jgi:hypothetical protein
MQLACIKPFGVLETRGFANGRQPNYLPARGRRLPWIGCESWKGTVWVPFRMLRERIPMLSAKTLDQFGARMRCENRRLKISTVEARPAPKPRIATATRQKTAAGERYR